MHGVALQVEDASNVTGDPVTGVPGENVNAAVGGAAVEVVEVVVEVDVDDELEDEDEVWSCR